MEGRFWRDTGGTFYDFDTVSKCRKVVHVWLPKDICAKLGDKEKRFAIPPKKPGEIRILSADIALMASNSHRNDATSIFLNQCLPMSGQRYMNSIVYGEAFEGMHTADQALRIRKLFDEFEADAIALDGRSIGGSIYDTLARDIVDNATGVVYPPLSCANNPDYAARCKDPGAPKAVWIILGSAKVNSDCAVGLRQVLRDGRLRLTITEEEIDDLLSDEGWYSKLSPYDKLKVQGPYINATALVYELVRLDTDTSSGLVKVKERQGERKDRYSSLSYNFYVAQQMEYKLKARRPSDDEEEEAFAFRPPKGRGDGGMRTIDRLRPWA